MKTRYRAYAYSMGEGVGEDASVGVIHGTGRVSLSRHYNFFKDLDFVLLSYRTECPFHTSTSELRVRAFGLKSLLRKCKKLSDGA